MGLTSLPLGSLKEIMGYLSSNYRSRLFTMYIINSPRSIFMPWTIAKGFLEENTVKKIQIIKDANLAPLFTHTNKSQVE
jgi:hypothetical protein